MSKKQKPYTKFVSDARKALRKKPKNPPMEVAEAWCIELAAARGGVGTQLADRYKEIVNQYPEWFSGSQYLLPSPPKTENMSSIDKAIESNQKMGELLKEYKESATYEQCEYDVVDLSMPNTGRSFYHLYTISTKMVARDGDAKMLRTWLSRRKVDHKKVCHAELIGYTEEYPL